MADTCIVEPSIADISIGDTSIVGTYPFEGTNRVRYRDIVFVLIIHGRYGKVFVSVSNSYNLQGCPCKRIYYRVVHISVYITGLSIQAYILQGCPYKRIYYRVVHISVYITGLSI